MKVHRLSSQEWQRLKCIRLAALLDAPDAFGSTFEVARGWSDDVWRQQVKDLPTFVATINGEDIGVARGATNGSNTDAYLVSLWVAPTTRGNRVGERLVAAVTEWARDAGYIRLLLDVADDNPAAIALYERLNFLPTGETSSYPPPRSHVTEHRRERML